MLMSGVFSAQAQNYKEQNDHPYQDRHRIPQIIM
jgi:hypothetical protein